MNCTYVHYLDEIPSVQWQEEMVNPVRKLTRQSESTIFHSSFRCTLPAQPPREF